MMIEDVFTVSCALRGKTFCNTGIN